MKDNINQTLLLCDVDDDRTTFLDTKRPDNFLIILLQ